jgi:hypothetical protein
MSEFLSDQHDWALTSKGHFQVWISKNLVHEFSLEACLEDRVLVDGVFSADNLLRCRALSASGFVFENSFGRIRAPLVLQPKPSILLQGRKM